MDWRSLDFARDDTTCSVFRFFHGFSVTGGRAPGQLVWPEHFVAFFVPHIVVYASSKDFVETVLRQPYLRAFTESGVYLGMIAMSKDDKVRDEV